MTRPPHSLRGESRARAEFASRDSQRAPAREAPSTAPIAAPFATRIVEVLRQDDAAFLWVRSAFEAGLRAGHWPQRPAPTGEEACAVACDTASGRILGAATFFCCGVNQVWLDLVFVGPEFRGAGVGRQLLEAVKAAAAEQGCVDVMFGTGFGNAAMQAVARAAGFGADHAVWSLSAPSRVWPGQGGGS